jgi:hypothetical protein
MNSSKELAIQTIKQAGERWPASFVPRREIPKFTGGLYSAATIANRDCDGSGISGAFKIGRQVCYPVASLVDWLLSKLEV